MELLDVIQKQRLRDLLESLKKIKRYCFTMFDQEVIDEIDETILQLNQVNDPRVFLPQYDDEAFSIRSISESKYSKS